MVDFLKRNNLAESSQLCIILCTDLDEAKMLEIEIIRTGYPDIIQLFDCRYIKIIRKRIYTRSRSIVILPFTDAWYIEVLDLFAGQGHFVIQFNHINLSLIHI